MNLLKLLYKYYLTDRPENSPVSQSDFDIFIQDFDFAKYKKQLFQFKEVFDIQTLKTIKYNLEYFDIFKISTKNDLSKKRLLIFAAVHGNEFATALVVPKLLKLLISDPVFLDEWHVNIITPHQSSGLEI